MVLNFLALLTVVTVIGVMIVGMIINLHLYSRKVLPPPRKW